MLSRAKPYSTSKFNNRSLRIVSPSGETIPFLSLGRVYKPFRRTYDDFMDVRTVILYGQSMLLSLVAVSLAKRPNLRVIQAATWMEVDSMAAECTPDVLIYGLEGASDSAIMPLLFKNPRLLLIALDVETNRAVLLTGQEARSLTLEQIQEIVEQEITY